MTRLDDDDDESELRTPRLRRRPARRWACSRARASVDAPAGWPSTGRPRSARPRARHAALRVRRDRAAGALPRVPRRVRRRRGVVRGQGVPVRRDGAPGGRGGPAPRRRHGRRAPRRAARRVPGRARSCSTATTSRSPSCGSRSTPGVGRIVADSFDELDRHRGAGRRRTPRAPRCSCGSRRASRRTRTSTSPPAPTTRSSGSRCRTARARRRARASPKSDALQLRRPPLPHRVAGLRARLVRRAAAVVVGLAADVGAPPAYAGRRDQPRWRARRALPADDPTPRHRRVRRERCANFADALADARRSTAPALMVEPGRSIAGPAGVTLYTRRHDQGDPGRAHLRRGRRRMSDNPRPVAYGAAYEAFLPAPRSRRARSWRRSRASTASRATSSCATRTCPPTSRSATCSSRR